MAKRKRRVAAQDDSGLVHRFHTGSFERREPLSTSLEARAKATLEMRRLSAHLAAVVFVVLEFDFLSCAPCSFESN